MPRTKEHQNLVDFTVTEVMSMSDEEIMAETSPEEIERAQQAFARALEAATTEAMYGGPAPKQRQTAIRARGNGFETVEIGDDGKVIEPVRCTCGSYAVFHRSSCPFAYGTT